jgi:hypothetical protein
MQLKPLIFSALAATAAAKQRCAAPEPTEEQLEVSKQMALEEANHLMATGDQFQVEASISVNVYFHVVASGTTVAAGYLSVRSGMQKMLFAPVRMLTRITECDS